MTPRHNPGVYGHWGKGRANLRPALRRAQRALAADNPGGPPDRSSLRNVPRITWRPLTRPQPRGAMFPMTAWKPSPARTDAFSGPDPHPGVPGASRMALEAAGAGNWRPSSLKTVWTRNSRPQTPSGRPSSSNLGNPAGSGPPGLLERFQPVPGPNTRDNGDRQPGRRQEH
jgi:hypothetical protein